MQGHVLRACNIPWDFFSYGEKINDVQDPRRKFTNRKGHEITMLEVICEVNTFFSSCFHECPHNIYLQKLDCAVDLLNPPDMSWGTVVNGTATGKIREIVDGNADLAVGAMVLDAKRLLVRSQ